MRVTLGLRLGFLVAALTAGCASPSGHQCNINTDCKLGSYCESFTCHIDCRADRDCTAGVCDLTLGKCTVVPDGGVPPKDMVFVLLDFSHNNNQPDFELPPAGDMATQPMLLKYGDVCTMDNQCTSGICSKNPFAPSDHECTGDCGNGCMFSDFCVGNLTCAQTDIGAPCNLANNGADCRGGACFGGNGAPAYCTVVCNSAVDCPSGFTCSTAVMNQNTRVCVNVDGTPPCASDANCTYNTACDITNARCLGDCRGDGDCPLFHKCNNGYCYPNQATGGGGIGATCQSANDCRSGACLGTTCLANCSVLSATGQWCPGGYGCNPISNGQGGYALECLPAGSGSPGAACVDNTSCASGLCVDMPAYCSRFCNNAPRPSVAPKCVALGVMADGVNLMGCSK